MDWLPDSSLLQIPSHQAVSDFDPSSSERQAADGALQRSEGTVHQDSDLLQRLPGSQAAGEDQGCSHNAKACERLADEDSDEAAGSSCCADTGRVRLREPVVATRKPHKPICRSA